MDSCSAGEGCSGFLVLLEIIARLIVAYPYVVLPVIGVIFYIAYKNAQPKDSK